MNENVSPALDICALLLSPLPYDDLSIHCTDVKLGNECSSSSSAICPFKLLENWQGCFGPTADG